MDEAEVVERMALVAHHQSPEVAEPREAPLHLPAALVASERTAILGLGAFPVPPMRGNHLDAEFYEGFIEGVGIIRPVADESLGQCIYEAGVEGGGDEGNFVRRSRGGTDGERKTSAVCHCHELRTFAPLGFSHTPAPRIL